MNRLATDEMEVDVMEVDALEYLRAREALSYLGSRNHPEISRFKKEFAASHPSIAGILHLILDSVINALDGGYDVQECRVIKCLVDTSLRSLGSSETDPQELIMQFAESMTTMLVAIRLDSGNVVSEERDENRSPADESPMLEPSHAPESLSPLSRYTTLVGHPSPLRQVCFSSQELGTASHSFSGLEIRPLSRTMNLAVSTPLSKLRKKQKKKIDGDLSMFGDAVSDEPICDFLHEAMQQDKDIDDDPRSLFEEIDYADSMMWDELIVDDNRMSFVKPSQSLFPATDERGVHNHAWHGRNFPPHLDLH